MPYRLMEICSNPQLSTRIVHNQIHAIMQAPITILTLHQSKHHSVVPCPANTRIYHDIVMLSDRGRPFQCILQRGYLKSCIAFSLSGVACSGTRSVSESTPSLPGSASHNKTTPHLQRAAFKNDVQEALPSDNSRIPSVARTCDYSCAGHQHYLQTRFER